MPRVVFCVVLGLLASACGSSPAGPRDSTAGLPRALLAQARPIGRGPAFHPPATGPVVGACRSRLGERFGVHVELFARNRVVLVAAGVGVRGPVRVVEGRIAGARCYGALVTLEPTGVVLVRPRARLPLSDLFRAWGQPLSGRRLGPFAGPVRVYVGGRRVLVPPGSVPLSRHSEIVLEVGPFVPPHAAYTFPPGT